MIRSTGKGRTPVSYSSLSHGPAISHLASGHRATDPCATGVLTFSKAPSGSFSIPTASVSVYRCGSKATVILFNYFVRRERLKVAANPTAISTIAGAGSGIIAAWTTGVARRWTRATSGAPRSVSGSVNRESSLA